MRNLYDNLLDYSTAVITAGSADADLPVANIQHPHKTKVYRTGTSAAEEWIKIDLATAKAVQAVILLAHTLTSGDTIIKIQGNATDSWSAPSFNEAMTFNASTLKHYLSSTQTYRWWRIIFTKSAAGETRDIGRVFLGPYDEMARAPKQPDGLDISTEDLSETSRALGGQTYSEIKSRYDVIKIAFPGVVSEAQSAMLIALVDACGTHTPFFVDIDPTNKPYDWLYYAKAKSLTGRKVIYKNGATILWDTSMELAEEI